MAKSTPLLLAPGAAFPERDLLIFIAATYLNAGWLREAVCMHMCPYAR